MEEPSADEQEILERKLKHYYFSRMAHEELRPQQEDQSSLKTEENQDTENRKRDRGKMVYEAFRQFRQAESTLPDVKG